MNHSVFAWAIRTGCRDLSINRSCCISKSFRSFHALRRAAHSVFRCNKMAGFGDDGFARSGWVCRDVDSSTLGLSRGEKPRNEIWYSNGVGLIGLKKSRSLQKWVNRKPWACRSMKRWSRSKSDLLQMSTWNLYGCLISCTKMRQQFLGRFAETMLWAKLWFYIIRHSLPALISQEHGALTQSFQAKTLKFRHCLD